MSEIPNKIEKEAGLNIHKQIDYTILDVKHGKCIYPSINLKNYIQLLINEYNTQFGINIFKYDEVRSKLDFIENNLIAFAGSYLRENGLRIYSNQANILM